MASLDYMYVPRKEATAAALERLVIGFTSSLTVSNCIMLFKFDEFMKITA